MNRESGPRLPWSATQDTVIAVGNQANRRIQPHECAQHPGRIHSLVKSTMIAHSNLLVPGRHQKAYRTD